MDFIGNRMELKFDVIAGIIFGGRIASQNRWEKLNFELGE
jgi:hypothetical protein